mgnify:CR=1 FL=1
MAAHRGVLSLLLMSASTAQALDLLRLDAQRTDQGVMLNFETRFDLPPSVEDALQRGVPHPNAVRLALERTRQDSGQPPPVALVLPEHVARRDAPVRPHAHGMQAGPVWLAALPSRSTMPPAWATCSRRPCP